MGEVVQLRDFQSKRDLKIITEAINSAISGEPVMVGMEPVVYIDTAPSEYVAPMDDPA